MAGDMRYSVWDEPNSVRESYKQRRIEGSGVLDFRVGKVDPHA